MQPWATRSSVSFAVLHQPSYPTCNLCSHDSVGVPMVLSCVLWHGVVLVRGRRRLLRGCWRRRAVHMDCSDPTPPPPPERGRG